MGECVAAVARRFEAVFVVSNDAVRDSVARACQALGVPWYSPSLRLISAAKDGCVTHG